jgi:putative hydrolase of the HAD superfamily
MSGIQAVLFDWVGTVVRPEPDRHIRVYLSAKELGYKLPLDKLSRSVYQAESQVKGGMPGLWRDGKDETPFLKWWDVLLADISMELPRESRLEITRHISHSVRNVQWVLYDDVLPVVKELKERGLILGVISNLYLGRGLLDPFLDIVVTAEDVGIEKPESLIFATALKQAKVEAGASIYIGDQYEIDIIGAKQVGISPILIDRYKVSPGNMDCPVISSFEEVLAYI